MAMMLFDEKKGGERDSNERPHDVSFIVGWTIEVVVSLAILLIIAGVIYFGGWWHGPGL